jgi:ParB family transcriptional regulator, chromosome partitioning protein
LEADVALDNKKRLGRGLDALLGGYPGEKEPAGSAPPAVGETGRRTLPVVLISRNPRNPRREFRPDDLQDLADSLKQHGIVQPLVVRRAVGAEER